MSDAVFPNKLRKRDAADAGEAPLQEGAAAPVLLEALVEGELFVEIVHRGIEERGREWGMGRVGDYLLGLGRVQESGLVIMRTIMPRMASYSA